LLPSSCEPQCYFLSLPEIERSGLLLGCSGANEIETLQRQHVALVVQARGMEMTPAELESFVIAESAAAWAALIEMDRERGGTGELHDTAVSLMRGRAMIAVHCDYRDDDRTLTAWFKLPQPLPGQRERVCEFLLDLHE
jgi:hypothetical protein